MKIIMKMKVVLLLFSLVARSVCAVHPAKDALAELRRSDPVDPVRWFADILNNTTPAPPGVPKVMVIGDSWAAVVAVNGNESFFDRKLVEHDCHVHSISLAIPGSTSGMWVKPLLLDALKVALALFDILPCLITFQSLGLLPRRSLSPSTGRTSCG